MRLGSGSTGMPWLPRAAAAMRAVDAAVVLVRRVHVRDGRTFVDCWAPGPGGQVWNNVPVLSGGGGVGTMRSEPVSRPGDTETLPNDPGETAAAQAILVFRAPNRRSPVCIGTLLHVQAELDERAVSDLDDDADHPGTVSIDDFGWRLGGFVMLLDGFGRCVLDARDAADVVRLQLSDDGVLRISRKGEATDRLLLASTTRSFLDELVGRYNDLANRVTELERAMQVLSSSYDNASMQQPPNNVLMAQPPKIQFLGDLGAQHQAPTSDELEAAAVKISADSR